MKFGPKIKHVIRKLWCEFRVNLTYWLFFFFFCKFWYFNCIFCGVHLFNANRKAHDCNPHIFIFLSICILGTNSTQNSKKNPYIKWKKVYQSMSFWIFLKMLFKRGKCLRANQINCRKPD